MPAIHPSRIAKYCLLAGWLVGVHGVMEPRAQAGASLDATRWRREFHDGPPKAAESRLQPGGRGTPAEAQAVPAAGLSLGRDGWETPGRDGLTQWAQDSMPALVRGELGPLARVPELGRLQFGEVLEALTEWGQPAMEALGDEVLVVTLDLGGGSPIRLLPGLPGQTVALMLRNEGPTIEVGGLDLKIGITGGASPAPIITGVNLRTGSTFTTANSVQGGDSGNSAQVQFWSVSIDEPFTQPTLAGEGATTEVGTLTLSTVGLTDGEWWLTLFSAETALLSPWGGTLPLRLVSGRLQVVPEPEVTVALVALGLLSWAVVRRRGSVT